MSLTVFGPTIDIALVATILAIVLQVFQRVFVNQKKLKLHQEEMKKKQKRISELTAKNNQQSKQEQDRLQEEVMQHFNEIMPEMFKQLIFSFIVVLPVWQFLQGNYIDTIISLPIPIPFFSAFDFFNPISWISFKLFESTNWIGWYILVSIIVGIILSIVLHGYEKIKEGSYNVQA